MNADDGQGERVKRGAWVKRLPAVCALGFWLVWPGGGLGAGEVYELAPFPVEAWTADTDPLTIPADVTWIGEAAIEDGLAGGMADLLRREANVQFRSVTGQPGTGELDLRGFGENSGLRVRVLVDGFKVNRPDMGGIDWQQIPLEEVESVEVIRGGQNVLYGNHAVGGVVKITTRKGGGQGVRLKGALGSHGFERGYGSVGGDFGNGWYRFSLHRTEAEGYREHSRTRARSGQLRAGIRPGKRDEVDLKVEAGESHVQYPGPLTYAQFLENPRQSRNAGNQYGNTETRGLAVRWLSRRDWGRLDLHAGFKGQELEGDLDGTYYHTEIDGLSFSPRLRFGNGRSFIILGGEVFHDALTFDDYFSASRDIAEARADHERLSNGVFAYQQVPLGDSLTLSFGARYERAATDYLYEKYDPDQINPYDPVIWDPFRPNPDYKDPPDILESESFEDSITQSGWAAEVSLNWRVSEHYRILAGFDRVYRYPALDEVAAYQGYPLDPPVNADLHPEEGNHFEMGIKRGGEPWEWGATLFHLRMENEIAYDESGGVRRNINSGPVRRSGVELALAYRNRHYGFSVRWSFVDAESRRPGYSGKTIPLVPGQYGVVSAWVRPLPFLRLSADCLHTGGRHQGGDFANALGKLDSHTLFGLQASVEWGEAASLRLRVRNLFDTSHVSTAFSGGYYPGSGRRYELVASIPFG